MHSSFLLLTVLIAGAWRIWMGSPDPTGSWKTRWQSALNAFCLPPLMLLFAAWAVLAMGHHGTMMSWSVSPVGCWISRTVLGLAVWVMVYTLGRAVQTEWRLRQYPTVTLPTGGLAHCLDIDLPIAAHIGLWPSSLLISRGWLEQLTLDEQQAMLAHEQAHADYRDPLCFLGLSMIRRFTCWLPYTSCLWKELLLLREIRADQQAARTHDPLLLAELLVKLSRQMTSEERSEALDLEPCIPFNETLSLSRLEQRVNALLEPEPGTDSAIPTPRRVIGLVVAALPIATTWLHT